MRPGAIVLGVVLTFCINGFDPISRYLIHSSSFTHSQMPFALLVGLLLLGYLYNPLVRRRFPRFALTRRDMAAVLAIGFLGTTVTHPGPAICSCDLGSGLLRFSGK